MRLTLIFVLTLALAGALFMTKPTLADFEAEVQAQLAEEITQSDPDAMSDTALALVANACKAGPAFCASVIARMMQIEYTDNLVYAQARIQLGNREAARCFGILSRVLCSRA